MKNIKIIGIFGNKEYYGHERSNVQVYTTLRENNFDLLILCNRKGLAKNAQDIFEKKDIKFKLICFPIWDDLRKPFRFFNILKYVYKVILHNISFCKNYYSFKPDFVYIGNDFMYISLIPSFILTNSKIVYRLGDAPVMTWLPFAFLWKNYIVKRTNTFVSISKYIQRTLTSAGRKTAPNDTVIYNYPPIRNKSHEQQEIGIIKKGLTFSYLGQIIEKKGVGYFVDCAIDLCDQYEHVYFLIAGNLTYSKDFAESLINKVKNSKHETRIQFLGNVENINDLFKKTDILVVPSIKQEPLGNVIVEAKSHSTPCVIFNTGGMPELINHLHDGFICSDTTEKSLKEGICYYINSSDKIHIHGKNAHDSIHKLGIDYNSYVNNWLNVFNNKFL